VSAVALQTFGFGEQLIRTVDREGDPWFVAKDVCGALEIGNHHEAVRKLDEDEVSGVSLADPHGREQQTTIVSESGMYTLVLRCRDATKAGTLPHRFKRWVTAEVLPAIRRTGHYMAPPPCNDDDAGAGLLPQAPDELERLRTGLLMVREARIAFGQQAARRMWELAGLPSLTISRPELRPNGLLDDMNRSIADWMTACCEHVPGHREYAGSLYDHYLDWCGREAMPHRTVAAFGRYLESCGIYRVKDGRGHRQRVGLRVKSGA
jgi:hypothetical protein